MVYQVYPGVRYTVYLTIWLNAACLVCTGWNTIGIPSCCRAVNILQSHVDPPLAKSYDQIKKMNNCNGGVGNLSKVPGVDKCLLGIGRGGVGGPFKQSVSQLPQLQIMHKPVWCRSMQIWDVCHFWFTSPESRVLPYIFDIVHAVIISAQQYNMHQKNTLVLGVLCRR